ncbi:serine/threonine protein kinase [Echria macrotheca]|uniref:Serine/threonine protein kinase n=1 Tax=Echria macrotheca TaxID=438768 RepID=A0AAJ0F6X8_9PEZI|nr:serine/threonine protein kinase [Echria macrotheca]
MPVSVAIATIEFEDRKFVPPRTGAVTIIENQTIRIGRDPDPEQNSLVFKDHSVSRNHLEIYSIVVDDQGRHNPLVFVRDRQTVNGTFVNNQLIARGPTVSAGQLLQDGDVIEIKPTVIIRFSQPQTASTTAKLTSSQREETALFADKYTIIDRTIGDGASSVVYLAVEKRTGKQVVCKVHNLAKGLRSLRKLQRIRQEAILMSYLDHPNILSFRAAFQTPQTMYIFTELATGGDLFSLFTRYEVFKEIEIRWIVRQILHAVVYIHGKGVAHRDIKPENILCAIAPDASYRIILSDFGDSAMTSAGRMRSEVGTTFYRAPECHTTDQGHNLSVDIWAIGMLTLQLLAGSQELPGVFEADLSSQEGIDDFLTMNLDDIYLGKITQNGNDFIRCCLQYDSEERITALEASRHVWLHTPTEDAELFRGLEAQSTAGWEPRGIMLPVIEDLTEKSLATEEDSRRDTANNTASRHFAARENIPPLLAHVRPQDALSRPGQVAQGPLPVRSKDLNPLRSESGETVERTVGSAEKRRTIDEGVELSKRRRPNSV